MEDNLYLSEDKNTNIKIITFLFQFLWVIVLLPKELQFIFFLIYAIVAVVKFDHKFEFNPITIGFSIYWFIYFLSIIINTVFAKTDIQSSRIIAAINTSACWLLATFIFTYVRSFKLEKDDLLKIGKYATINIAILFGLYLVMLFSNINSIKILNEIRYLRTIDYSFGETGTRFQGLFEYSALVGLFVLLQLPLAYSYLKRYNNLLIPFILVICSLLPVVASKSRICIAAVGLEVLVIVIYEMKNILKKAFIPAMVACAIAGVAVLVFTDIVPVIIDKIFNMREGSNNTRMDIYITSLQYCFNTNPFIGAGIKHTFMDVPLGSHSTYIGIIYKTGVIGAIIFLIASVLVLVEYLSKLIHTKMNYKLLFLAFLAALAGILMLEDIDGSDWLILMTSAIIALNINCFETFIDGSDDELGGEYELIGNCYTNIQ